MNQIRTVLFEKLMNHLTYRVFIESISRYILTNALFEVFLFIHSISITL